MKESKQTSLVDIDEELEKAVSLANKLYFSGGVFVHPTDTIYGFAANPFNKDALNEIAKLKQRDEDKKFILLIHSIAGLLKYVKPVHEMHIDFLVAIWPNPISVVLPVTEEVSDLLGTKDIAFRIPAHNFCNHLLERIETPVVSTSVNRSGEPPLNDPDAILQEFRNEIDALLFTRKRQMQISSTVINLTGTSPVLVRKGRIPYEYILQEYNTVFVQNEQRENR